MVSPKIINYIQCTKLCDNLINKYCEAQPMQVMHCKCTGSHIRQQKAAMQLCSQMPIAHSGWTIRMKHKIQILKSSALLSAILYPLGWFAFLLSFFKLQNHIFQGRIHDSYWTGAGQCMTLIPEWAACSLGFNSWSQRRSNKKSLRPWF